MAIDEIKIGVTYCNEQSFTHSHKDPLHAAKEYVDLLVEAIEPTSGAPEAKHIRMITFIVFDERGEITGHVDSGIFHCKHVVEEK